METKFTFNPVLAKVCLITEYSLTLVSKVLCPTGKTYSETFLTKSFVLFVQLEKVLLIQVLIKLLKQFLYFPGSRRTIKKTTNSLSWPSSGRIFITPAKEFAVILEPSKTLIEHFEPEICLCNNTINWCKSRAQKLKKRRQFNL